MGRIINWSSDQSAWQVLSRGIGGVSFYGSMPETLRQEAYRGLVISAIITCERATEDGALVQVLEPAWLAVLQALRTNPNALLELTPRQFEELIAASYKRRGFDDVILTPLSGDGGRDVIAVRKDWGTVRFVDQAKRFRPDRPVTANDCRAMLGVLAGDRNATKGYVTTTSTFAPGIASDPSIAPFVPYRLELIDGDDLVARLLGLSMPAKE